MRKSFGRKLYFKKIQRKLFWVRPIALRMIPACMEESVAKINRKETM